MKVEYKNVNIFEIDKDKKGTSKVVSIINWKISLYFYQQGLTVGTKEGDCYLKKGQE
jgi:hypothetical protein